MYQVLCEEMLMYILFLVLVSFQALCFKDGWVWSGTGKQCETFIPWFVGRHLGCYNCVCKATAKVCVRSGKQ